MAKAIISYVLTLQTTLFSFSSGSCTPLGRRCKAAPGTPDWPSMDAWSWLNQELDGRLLKVPSPAAVCHPEQPTYDLDACSKLQVEWPTQSFHSYDPVSLMTGPNVEFCMPDPQAPCHPEGFPAYVINATTAYHVKRGVEFAKRHNVRLVVKAGGHDFHARSSAPGALSIWVSNMQDIVHHNTFQPKDCNLTIEGTAVTAGSGTRGLYLSGVLDKLNQTLPAGGGRTVALGGYVTSAGHSMVAPRTGLAADLVLEMEMVAPDGEILILNECQNTELFWAARGGGGSTFGVVTSMTLQTKPALPVITWSTLISMDQNDPALFDLMAYISSSLPELETKGITGYIIVAKSFSLLGDNLSFGLPSPNREARVIAGFIIQGDYTENDLRSRVGFFLDQVKEKWPQVALQSVSDSYPSFYSRFQVNYDTNPVGYPAIVGGRLLDAKALTANLTASKLAFEAMAEDGIASAFVLSGKAVWDAKPRGGCNSVCPAWRRALVVSGTGTVYAPNNITARTEAIAKMDRKLAGLRAIAPDMGVYQNEGSPFEPDWQHQFWGINYERLLDIKRRYDPDDVFWCHPCVGNHGWEEVGYSLCRVA